VLADLWWKAAKEGRDVRALTALFDRLYATEQHIEMPSTLDALEKLTRDQRRILLRQIEDEDGPSLVECPHCAGPLLASRLPGGDEGTAQAGSDCDCPVG
jgi:hypothetical protein